MRPCRGPVASLQPLNFLKRLHFFLKTHNPFSLCLQAKAKEKTYELRREAPRGIQVTYPIPEPVITPRAREGLRTVVPTIFPPSTVNRGESVHLRPPEPERRPRPTPPASLAVQESRFPKKRGRKPKLHLHYDKDDGSTSAEPNVKRSRSLEEPMSHGVSKLPRRLHHQGETSDHSLLQLTKRFQEETTITPKSSSEQRHVGGTSLSYSRAFSPDMLKNDQGGHRTICLSRVPISQPCKMREHPSRTPWEQSTAISAESIQESSSRPSWSPCFSNLDTVTVTDVTMNFLTVTIRESSTDKGFFRDKR